MCVRCFMQEKCSDWLARLKKTILVNRESKYSVNSAVQTTAMGSFHTRVLGALEGPWVLAQGWLLFARVSGSPRLTSDLWTHLRDPSSLRIPACSCYFQRVFSGSR